MMNINILEYEYLNLHPIHIKFKYPNKSYFRRERGNCKICWEAKSLKDVDTNGIWFIRYAHNSSSWTFISNLTVGKSLLHITLGKNASVKGGLGGDAAHQCCGYAGDGTCYLYLKNIPIIKFNWWILFYVKIFILLKNIFTILN